MNIIDERTLRIGYAESGRNNDGVQGGIRIVPSAGFAIQGRIDGNAKAYRKNKINKTVK